MSRITALNTRCHRNERITSRETRQLRVYGRAHSYSKCSAGIRLCITTRVIWRAHAALQYWGERKGKKTTVVRRIHVCMYMFMHIMYVYMYIHTKVYVNIRQHLYAVYNRTFCVILFSLASLIQSPYRDCSRSCAFRLRIRICSLPHSTFDVCPIMCIENLASQTTTDSGHL